MKKIFVAVMAIITIFLTGCGKPDEKELKKKFVDNVENLKSYYMEGTLKLNNNDDNYTYDVKVGYLKEDFYKVSLINQANNYEQNILRNETGVYVVTPALNKSFKFQSEWPYNNSQIYLLESLANDLDKDEEFIFEQKDDNYIFTTKVNYPNNQNLVKQKITLDKNLNLKQVEVLSKDDIPNMTFTVKELDTKAKFSDNYFDIETITDEFNQENPPTKEDTNTTAAIDESLFPLYLPDNTNLSNKEVIDTTNGQRIIMTFAGDTPFILVEETVKREEELTIIPTYGEPFMLVDTIGSLTDASYTWISNGIEYYIVSDVMKQNELLEVAKSINVIATIAEK